MSSSTDTPTVRQSMWYRYDCTIPEIALTAEDDAAIPPEVLSFLEQGRGLPCDGGGVPGPWCERCPWGKCEEYDDV